MKAGVGSGSLTARLAVLFAATTCGLLIMLALALDRAVVAHFDELDAHNMAIKERSIAALMARTTTEAALVALPGRLEELLAAHETPVLWVALPDRGWSHAVGADRFKSLPPTPPWPAPAAHTATGHPPKTGQRFFVWPDDQGLLFAFHATQVRVPLPVPEQATLLLGLDVSHHSAFLNAMRLQLGLGIGFATLLAGLFGWLAAHRGLAPLRRVTATARKLSAQGLSERLSEHEAPTEMRELVEAFNGMLERLEGAFHRLSDFSADIAHELRTPVSNLMTETQVALSRPRTAKAYQEVLHSNLEEFDRLARMIADMLFLAKADNGLLPRPAKHVALADEALALLDFYEALAEENRIALTVSGHATVRGDSLMLRRALSNLLSNAIRHTPQGGTVAVRITQSDAGVVLAVENPGPPIPAAQHALLFERFYRVDPSRARQGEGAGLGLAITRSIVQAHGGQITVHSDAQKTVFSMCLPTAQGGGDTRCSSFLP